MNRLQHILCHLSPNPNKSSACAKIERNESPQLRNTNCSASVSSANGKTADLKRIANIAFGFMSSKALFSALDIRAFDVLSTSPNATAEQISQMTCVEVLKLEVLLKCLLELGLVEFNAHHQTYKNTAVVEKYMVSKSANYFGNYYKNQIAKQMYPRMFQLSNILMNYKNEENTSSSVMDEVSYESWFKDKKEAELYSLSQHNGSMMVGFLIFKIFKKWFANYTRTPMNILDVGGGTGAVSIGLCLRVPNLNAHVLDLENVIQTARESIVPDLQSNIAHRMRYYSGSALDKVWNVDTEKNKMDVVLFSYLLVSIDYQCIDGLFAKARNALVKGGRIIIHDFIYDENVVSDEKQQELTALWLLQHVTINSKVGLLTPLRLTQLLKKYGFGKFEVFPALPHLTGILTAIVL